MPLLLVERDEYFRTPSAGCSICGIVYSIQPAENTANEYQRVRPFESMLAKCVAITCAGKDYQSRTSTAL
jgi:hypothetical protein